MHILSTPRLQLREFITGDAPFLMELVNSPGWLEYIGDRGVKNIADAEGYIQNRLMPSYRSAGFGFWLVELKEGAVPVGMCGLVKRDDLEDVDIGFAFLPQYMGRGYGYEAASATLAFAKEPLGLKRVVAITVGENKASIELLKKIGLSFQQMIVMKDEELMLFGVGLFE